MQLKRDNTDASSRVNRESEEGCVRMPPSNKRIMRYRTRAWIRASKSTGVVGGDVESKSFMRESNMDIKTGEFISFLVM